MMCDESAEEGLGREWSVGITSFTPLPEQLEADVALNMLSSSLSSRREGGRAAPKRQEITRAEPKRSTSYLWFDGAPAAMQTSYISHATWYAFRGDDAWILIQDKLHPGVLSSPKNEFGAAAGCRLSTLGQELELLGGSAPEDIEPFTTRVNKPAARIAQAAVPALVEINGMPHLALGWHFSTVSACTLLHEGSWISTLCPRTDAWHLSACKP